MNNLFIYGSFMQGQINHKYLKNYSFMKAILSGYRRCWPRNKDTAILIKSPLGSVKGELYFNITEQDLLRIKRLHGFPYNYTLRTAFVTTFQLSFKFEASIFYPADDIIREWLRAEDKERMKKSLIIYQPS